MRLRKLEKRDAPLMLEWMQNKEVVCFLNTDFSKKRIEDCLDFIKAAETDDENLHLAIVDDNDEYMGTVSLKNIDNRNKTAEFAITIRECAMGKGYSQEAMQLILQKGINELRLRKIIWCVSPYNKRAIRFYDKNGYRRIEVPTYITGYDENVARCFIWYGVNVKINENE